MVLDKLLNIMCLLIIIVTLSSLSTQVKTKNENTNRKNHILPYTPSIPYNSPQRPGSGLFLF